MSARDGSECVPSLRSKGGGRIAARTATSMGRDLSISEHLPVQCIGGACLAFAPAIEGSQSSTHPGGELARWSRLGKRRDGWGTRAGRGYERGGRVQLIGDCPQLRDRVAGILEKADVALVAVLAYPAGLHGRLDRAIRLVRVTAIGELAVGDVLHELREVQLILATRHSGKIKRANPRSVHYETARSRAGSNWPWSLRDDPC